MEAWGLSDTGNVREQNQDYYRIEPLKGDALLAVVCDGMGGAKAGNVASRLACEVFTEEVSRSFRPDQTPKELQAMLRGAAALANTSVFEHSKLSEEFTGMGTTLVAVMVRGRKATVVNVGDSRAYHVGKSGIRQVTKDHSLVQMMVDRGELTPEVAKSYPGKNFITRAIGTETTVLCDIFHLDVGKGDYLLLCSDGLSNLLDDQEILFEVVHGVYKQNCCKRLLNIAKNRGAPDNVTSVLIAI